VDGHGDSEIAWLRGDQFYGRWKGDASWHLLGVKDSVGTQERTKKVSVGSQFETSQSTSGGNILQIRGDSNNSQNPTSQLVDVHIRPQGRLLSRGDREGIKAVVGNSLEKPLVSLQCPAIWSEPLPLCFHQSGKTDGATLEENGHKCGGLYRRFHCDGSKQGHCFDFSQSSGEGLGQIGLASGTYKGRVGAITESGSVGSDIGFSATKGVYSSTKGGQDHQMLEEDFQQFGAYCEEVGKGGWFGDQCVKGFCSSSSVHSQDLFSNEEGAIQEGGLGCTSDINSRRGWRSDLVSREHLGFEWENGLETFFDEGSEIRRFTDGLGRRVEWPEGRRVLEKGSQQTYRLFGDSGIVQELSGISRSTEGMECSDGDRQFYSIGIHEQWWRPSGRADRVSESDLGVVYEMGSQYRGDSVDSKQTECGSRPGESMGGLGRLESTALGVCHVGSEVGTSHTRPFCLRYLPSSTAIRFSEVLPRCQCSQHVHSALGGSEQLVDSSLSSDPSISHPFARVSSTGNDNCSTMGRTAMVATSDANDGGMPFSSISRRDLYGGTLGKEGTLEKSSLEVLGSEAEWEKMTKSSKRLFQGARVASTQKSYDKDWLVWEDFCRRFDCSIWTSDKQVMINFLVYLDISGKAASASRFCAAIKSKYKEKGLSDPWSPYRVNQALKGLLRLAASKKVESEERQPLPVEAIANWLQRKPLEVTYKTWIRNAAILVVGFRCMRRPGDFGKLKGKHLWKKDGWYYLKIPVSKTDQLRRYCFVSGVFNITLALLFYLYYHETL
jgi:hypothetical protein